MKNSTFNNNTNIVGTNLKKYRELNNISQEQLCNKLALLGITLYKRLISVHILIKNLLTGIRRLQ